MINLRRGVAVSVLAVGMAGVVACSPSGSASQGSSADSKSTSSTSASAESGSGVSPEHNQADVRFVRMMIPHHKQAVRMAEIVLSKEGLDPDVRRMAEKIKSAQGPQIEKMRSWLNAWNAGPAMSIEMARGMQGVLSSEEIAELKQADAKTASKLFLKQMIEHHKGAVAMAQKEIRKGTNPDAKKLAREIVKSQKSQIEKMRSMLENL